MVQSDTSLEHWGGEYRVWNGTLWLCKVHGSHVFVVCTVQTPGPNDTDTENDTDTDGDPPGSGTPPDDCNCTACACCEDINCTAFNGTHIDLVIQNFTSTLALLEFKWENRY